MGSDRSFVSSTESGCQIFRETSGCYVALHALNPDRQVMTPTLAGAYAACRGWELAQQRPAVPAGG
jgi:hypothetical protein